MDKLWLFCSRLLALLFCLVVGSRTVDAQRLPQFACSEYFEYLSHNNRYIGRISVRHDPQYEKNELVVEFSQRGAYHWSYIGNLALQDNQVVTNSNIKNGYPINYRVDFPIPTSPPKLTKIKLNNVVLCSDEPYAPPNTAITLMHTLQSRTVPLAFLDAQGPPQWQFNGAQGNQYRPIDTFDDFQVLTPRPPVEKQPQPDFGSSQIWNPPIQQSRPDQLPAPSPKLKPLPTNNQQIDQRSNAICGRERTITTPLIFQGEQLQLGQQPWLVGLFERSIDNGLIFFCGGTLLTARTVVSAAHCFRFSGRDLPASRTVVSLGRNTIDIVSDGKLQGVSQLLYHDNFNPESANADILLIRMTERVTFTDYIVPICLWNENYVLQLPANHLAYVAGWGADGEGNVNTWVSKITDINIIIPSRCRNELPPELVEPNTICAKHNARQGPCGSDGGGGLILRENDMWVLRGIISGGVRKNNTCDLSKPTLYTDVAKYIDWVRTNMWD